MVRAELLGLPANREVLSSPSNVLLVLPPLYHTGREPDYNPKEPMNLMCLASHLRFSGISAEILDADVEALSLEQTIERIVKPGQDVSPVIGFSVFQRSLPSLELLVGQLRERGVESHITLGGITASLSHDAILRRLSPKINSIVLGEGEETLLKLSRKILSRQDWREVPGIAFMSDKEVVVTSKPEKIKPANYLPPSRDYLEFCLGKTNYATVLSSRGCYARCGFCSNFAFENLSAKSSRWRPRNPEAVVSEIEAIANCYGTRIFKFNDPNLFGPGRVGRQHVIELCNQIIKRDLDLSLMAFCRGNDIAGYPEIVALMREAGFERLLIGVESADDDVLKKFHKGETMESMEEAIELAHRHGMSVVIGFMIFNPYTTLETIKKDIKFLKRRGFTPALSKSLRVFDQTPLQFELEKEGRLIPRNSFEGYHEYTVPVEIASIYIAMKTLAVHWFDVLRKFHQDKIWEVKKAPSFSQRERYYFLTDQIFDLELSFLQALVEWTESGFTEGTIEQTVTELYNDKFVRILNFLNVTPESLPIMAPARIAGEVLDIINNKPYTTFKEKYRWHED